MRPSPELLEALLERMKGESFLTRLFPERKVVGKVMEFPVVTDPTLPRDELRIETRRQVIRIRLEDQNG